MLKSICNFVKNLKYLGIMLINYMQVFSENYRHGFNIERSKKQEDMPCLWIERLQNARCKFYLRALM